MPAESMWRPSSHTMVTIPWKFGCGAFGPDDSRCILINLLIVIIKSRNKFDPSDCSYIKWCQETFHSGGHKAEIVPLLERCTRELQKHEKYRNDIRYLRVWIQYVSGSYILYELILLKVIRKKKSKIKIKINK